MERFSESARSLEDDGESSCKDDADDEAMDEEQLSVLTSQKSEPPTQNHSMGTESPKVKGEVGAQEEARSVYTEDMDMTRSKAASAADELPPMSSQNDIIVHTTEDELRNLK